jgi:hypothetical protein
MDTNLSRQPDSPVNRMPTTTEKMTTCDCCGREMCIEDLTDHHGEWLCSKCEEELEVNDDEEDDE